MDVAGGGIGCGCGGRRRRRENNQQCYVAADWHDGMAWMVLWLAGGGILFSPPPPPLLFHSRGSIPMAFSRQGEMEGGKIDPIYIFGGIHRMLREIRILPRMKP